MPDIWVRAGVSSVPPVSPEAWVKLVEPKRVWLRRNNQWDPIGTLSVRHTEGGVPVWKTVKTWSPITPTGLKVPTAQFHVHTQTTLEWDAVPTAASYNLRQSQWNATGTAIEGSPAVYSVVGTTKIVGTLQNKYYSYEIQSVGSNGLASDWSAPYGYRNGADEVRTAPIADYGWGATEHGGITGWAAASGAAGAPIGNWDNVHPAWHATDGTGHSTWGWLGDRGTVQECNTADIGNARFDFIGPVYGAPFWPYLEINPGERVKINSFQLCHSCLHGWKVRAAFGFDVFSRGTIRYSVQKFNGGSHVQFFTGDFAVDAVWPGHGDYVWTEGRSFKLPVNIEINAPAGDRIRVYILEAPPIPGESGVGDRTRYDERPAQAVPNIRYTDFWYNKWEVTSYHTDQVSPAYASSTWVVP